MVDATVSMVLTRLAPMIEQRVREEVCMMINSTAEASNLASKLKIIKELLNDAEQKGVTDPKVKSWLNKLEDISYEMDDVLDELDWENTNLRLDLDEPASDPWHKVCSFLESLCLCFQRVVERRNINLNIKNLNERLDGIREQNEKEFNFAPNVSRDYSQDSNRVIETTSLVEVSKVHGRDDDKEILVRKLLSEAEGSSQIENGVQVISIVGLGGLGKTTLAQLVYNDEKVEKHFPVKMWVCVSDPFDQIKIAKAILEELTKQTPNLSRLQTLVGEIEEAISGKTFLLVLDDVWTEDRTVWDPIKNSLQKGSPSSRILVTTRKENVANVMGSNEIQIHRLRQLPHSECWKVFKQSAFIRREEDKNLEEVGRAIVEKCNGLPLAAKVMGGLLGNKNSLEEWRMILNSPVWKLETARKEIFPFLVLSYNELNPVAKRCFSYCAIFPKDTEIKVDELIRIWCAQGFFSSDDMELKGRETFDDLAMRSFFQDFEREDIGVQIVGCKMHDIVHDFAQFLTENECVIAESIDCGEKSRHFNLVVKTNKNPFPLPNGKWHGYEKCRSFFTRKCAIPLDLLKHLKRVRVLVMIECELKVIGREIGSSIHLRYLDLTANFLLKELPETICDLYNLQTLILDSCFHLSRLPEGIHKLRNLRHLLNERTEMEFPQGLGELTNLQTLSQIDIAPGRNWKNLGLLRNLNHLHGSLSIDIRISGSDDPDELVQAIERANLKTKNLIQHLTLWFSENVPIEVIEALQPHLDLKSLYLRCLFLPEWFTALTQLKCLYLEGEICSLPALGKLMPFLETLSIDELNGMEILRHEFLGISGEPTNAFPRLKTLQFKWCSNWKEWEDISEEEESNNNISVFPSLQTLKIRYCRKLEALPHRLLRKATSLKNLKVYGCGDKVQASYNDWIESRG